MSRKPVFSHEDIKKDFITAIKMGFSNEKACAYAGVSEPTLYTWLNKGEEDEKNGNTKSIYFKFFKDYKKAKSDFVMRHMVRITEASDNGNWQASAWLLERRCPQDFAIMNKPVDKVQKVAIVSDVPTEDDEEQ